MTIYSHIEECYCTVCQRNVGIEYTRLSDGTVTKRCLSRSCLPEELRRDLDAIWESELAHHCLFHTAD